MDALETLDIVALETVDGGNMATFKAAVSNGAYQAYKTVVSYPTAAYGGWQLANQMYGDKVTMHDRFRAMGEVRSVVMASDDLPLWSHTLPAWAHF
jgi:hypothetical protein